MSKGASGQRKGRNSLSVRRRHDSMENLVGLENWVHL